MIKPLEMGPIILKWATIRWPCFDYANPSWLDASPRWMLALPFYMISCPTSNIPSPLHLKKRHNKGGNYRQVKQNELTAPHYCWCFQGCQLLLRPTDVPQFLICIGITPFRLLSTSKCAYTSTDCITGRVVAIHSFYLTCTCAALINKLHLKTEGKQ